MSNGPTQIWAHGEDPKDSTGSQFGCAMCVFQDNNDVPLKRVYFWGGATYCSRHLKGLQQNA